MRTFLLIQALVLFLIALKLLKTSDETPLKKYSQGLDVKKNGSVRRYSKAKTNLYRR